MEDAVSAAIGAGRGYLYLECPLPFAYSSHFFPLPESLPGHAPNEFHMPEWVEGSPGDVVRAMMGVRKHPLQHLYPHIGDRVFNHEFFPLDATWYLHPTLHIVEAAIWVGVLCVFFYHFRHLRWLVWHPASEVQSWTGAVLDKVVGFLVIAIYPIAALYKFLAGEGAFMLQPCQMANVLLIFLALAPKSSPAAASLFNIYLHNLFGMLMSIVDPDLSAEDLPYEAEVHLLQHLLLGIVPLYYILRRRYPVYRRRMASSYWMTVYHWLVLLPLALPLNANLNYIMAPPRRSPWLAGHVLYRLGTGTITLPVGLITYELWVAPTVKFVHAFDRSKSRVLKALPPLLLTAFVVACFGVCEAYLQFMYGDSRASLLQAMVLGATRQPAVPY